MFRGLLMSKTCEICDEYIDDNFYGSKFCDSCRDDFKTSDSDKR